MDSISFIKIATLLDPNCRVMFDGWSDSIMKATTVEELMILFTRISRQFYRNQSIPIEERYRIFKYNTLLLREETDLCGLFNLLKDNDKKILVEVAELIKSINAMVAEPIQRVMANKTEEEKLSVFKRMMDMYCDMDKNVIPIDQLLEPMTIIANNEMVPLINTIIQQLETASPDKLKMTLDTFRDKFVMISEGDFELDCSTLTIGQLRHILDILH